MNAFVPQLDISEDLIRRFDSLGPRYTSYPTADRFSEGFGIESYISQLEKRRNAASNPPLSVYVHLPFCASLCYYCACNKVITKDRSKSARYLGYLEKEMALLAPHLGAQKQMAQLHFGGGTPTFLSRDELSKLMQLLRAHVEFTPDAELGIEIDPRTLEADSMAFLASLGFNRTSLGVQDFDPVVQQAVHRIQPVAMVEQAINASRAAGFTSINFDLIYGLPKQTLTSFDRTLDEVLRLSPDRIALYNYAHLPTRFKAQRRIAEADLPSAEERLQIFMLSTRRLLDAGYVYIGLDHFAKPDDELAKAAKNHSLHRNFQGYTTRAECDLIGLGMSSIGKIGDSYIQNLRILDEYYDALDADTLPVEKGIALSQDDVLRREIIMRLMCSRPVEFAEFESRFAIAFVDYFAKELAYLRPYQDAGLIEITYDGIAVLPKGRLFVRAFGMMFDRFLSQPNAARYSKLI